MNTQSIVDYYLCIELIIEFKKCVHINILDLTVIFNAHSYKFGSVSTGYGVNVVLIFQVTRACKKHGGFYLGSIGGPAAILAENCIKKLEILEYPEFGEQWFKRL